MHKFKGLDVYRKVLTFTRLVRETTKRFPKANSLYFHRKSDARLIRQFLVSQRGLVTLPKELVAML
jgi:hypothetical protein